MAHLLWGLGSKSDQIMHYINGMIELEQEYLKGGIIAPLDNYTKVACCVSAILAILARAVPLLFGFASGIDTQFPANMLSFAFRKYLKFQFFVDYPLTLSTISLIVNMFMYYLVSFIGALFGAHFFISFATARNLLFCVLRSVDRAQIIYDLMSLPHTSLKRNQLQLALSKTVKRNVLRGYRKMQLLWNVFNQIHSSFLVNFVLANGHVQILSVCFVLQISKRSSQQHSGFFPCLLATMATMDAICIIIGIFSSSAGVHSASVKVKRSLGEYQRKRMMRGAMMTKIIQSLPEVKTKFGVSNFIDKLTPLKFQSFIINRILDLLLCGYNRKI
ncbi:unnamed protein product [Orchesella dallaii]|uniref:Uncharacterized protein n=1 Tax=Orchesella dallaii TaxID=48710 RepID=A0ABP1RBZ9_9HEXA